MYDVFQAYLIDGTPAMSASPSWKLYVDSTTGLGLTQPAFLNLTGAFYKFDADTTGSACGIIDLGSECSPRYLHVAASVSGTFVGYDLLGDPSPSLSASWLYFYNVSTGIPGTGPTITSLGGGIYKTELTTNQQAGVIDFSTASLQRYCFFDSLSFATSSQGGGGTPPYATNFVPAVGSTISPSSSIAFDVIDPNNNITMCVIVARFSGSEEVVHDGTSFSEMYSNVVNQRTVTAGGYHFIVLKDGGWRYSPTFDTYIVDGGVVDP